MDNADSAYQPSDASSVDTSLTGVVSTLLVRSSDCESDRENDRKNQKSNRRICNNFYNLRSTCTVSSSESNELTENNESNKSPVCDESNGLINSNESNESRGSSHKLSNESNKSFHLTRSTGTNTHHSHEEDKISDNGSANTNGTNSNKVVKSHVLRCLGLCPVVQSTHNKFGKSDRFEKITHTHCLFITGSSETTNQKTKKLKYLYSSCLFLNGLKHCDSLKDLSTYVNVAKAITTYNNLDATLTMPQYSVKKGLCIFGEAETKAILKDIQQLCQRQVIIAMDPRIMMEEQRKTALAYLMYLKHKRNGDVKGWGCADGRGQWEFILKEETSAPTVSLYALLITCLIDASYERFVATADIPGAFLQTDQPNNEEVILRITGTLAEILAKLDPKVYCNKIIDQNGRKILYTRSEKAIYGTLCADKLFWENITNTLGGSDGMGFIPNPYDACTMNKIINGSQAMVVFHVDDLKVSHKDPEVVNNILDKLDDVYGTLMTTEGEEKIPLKRTYGKVHEYVGMTIDFSEKGKVIISMFDYVEDTV